MLESFIKKISFFISKEELKGIDSQKKSIEENNIKDEKLVNVNVGNFIEIDIKKCEFKEFLQNSDEINKFNINMSNYIYDDNIMEQQKNYIIEKNNLKYFITVNDNKIIISEYLIKNSNIYETKLKIKNYPLEYKISRLIHDLNYSTKEHKSYSNLDESNNLLKEFTLDKVDAFKLIQMLLINLGKIDNINDIINFNSIYDSLNLVSEDSYYPVISNEELTLSWPFRFSQYDINKEKDVILYIVLNKTKELIGTINFNYTHEGFSYQGNVGYSIKYQYQNNHYATSALKLLKELLKNNTFEVDKDLYLSIVPNNIKSQKVIKNNGGQLIYEGPVPENNSLYYIDGVKDVKVYKIDMKNKKS